MEKKKIYLASPTMHREEQEYIKEAFDTNWIAPLGPHVNQFEKEMSEFLGVRDSAALSAGTAALHLAVKLLDIRPGDVVLCSTLTFSASANPAAYEKAKLVFIDSEPDTWNMSPEALRRGLEKYPQAKAVILVHLYGTPARLDEIMALGRQYGVPLIEDAAESLGAVYHGRQTGTFGKMGIFSFNGNKIITTSGGGMLVSDDESLTAGARFLATQAREPQRHYEHKVLGYNYRMSNVLAGMGRGQLLHLKEHIAKKKEIYLAYRKAFEEIPQIHMNPYCEQDSEPNFWLSAMTIDEGCPVKPLDVMVALEKENIECRPIWKPMHMQPVYRGCDFIVEEGCGKPISEEIFAQGLCLPSDIKNTKEDMELIIRIIKNLFC